MFAKYGKKMIANIFKKGNHYRFACYDMTMTILPAMLISFLGIFVNLGFLLAGMLEIVAGNEVVPLTVTALLRFVGWYYGVLFKVGFMTVLTEWKKIYSPAWEKILYTFTFPLFMFTYIPIAVVALFKDVEWKPIAHTVAKSIDEVR